MEKQTELKGQLAKILNDLKHLEDPQMAFLETEESDQEIRINGNLQGLLTLARSVLQTALGSEGSHQHFDEHGMLDSCDRPFIVALKDAD